MCFFRSKCQSRCHGSNAMQFLISMRQCFDEKTSITDRATVLVLTFFFEKKDFDNGNSQ